MKLEEFKKILNDGGIELSEKMITQLNEYQVFLKEYNEKINLTGITEYEQVLEKHFLDSLLCAFIKKPYGTLVDVGTGAGFPGVVLKICFPKLKVTLLEPLNKRCVFLNLLIERLGLKDIEVINVRGEDHSLKNREKYDFVTARAVSNLNALIEVCGAMVKVNGYFIALRGLSGAEEIKEAQNAIKIMGFEVESTAEKYLSDGSKRVISFFKKTKPSPNKYPRKYNIIKQKSL